MQESINIFRNKAKYTETVYKKTKSILEDYGYRVNSHYDENAVLNLVIGGDGTFLKAVHKTRFSPIEFAGINTGHLGFYQEIDPDNVENFIKKFINKNYRTERFSLLDCKFKNKTLHAINEIVIKSSKHQLIRLKVFIDGNFVENFSGDGLIISTAHGSTAYNLSCGGSILHESLRAFQLTPIAPVYSSSYRSLKNSIVCPESSSIEIIVSKRDNHNVCFIFDGKEYPYRDYKLTVCLSEKRIKKIVLDSNRYWSNLKEKFM